MIIVELFGSFLPFKLRYFSFWVVYFGIKTNMSMGRRKLNNSSAANFPIMEQNRKRNHFFLLWG